MQVQALSRAASLAPTPSQIGDGDEVRLIGVAKAFSRDEEIYGQGEAADAVYRVVSGAIRQVRVLADGRRQISDFYLPGDIFGLELGLERSHSAEAVGDAMVTVTRRSALVADPQNGAALWRQAVADLRRSQDHVLTLGRR